MNIPQGFAFDDVLLIPQYSEVLPKDASLKTKITKNISLNIPIVSAAMDTVTEGEMAISMALHGGVGIIHKNNTPETQAELVRRVKRFENGFIRNPLVLSPKNTIADVIEIREKMGFKSIPITKEGKPNGELVGLITRNDYLAKHQDQRIEKRMRGLPDLLTAYEPLSLSEANKILSESKFSRLLLLKKDGSLSALISRRDLEKNEQYPLAIKDTDKRLIVGAAVGPANDAENRIVQLIEAGVDFLVVDTAHGHSKGVISLIKYIKKTFPKIDVIGGNIATTQAAKDLIAAGADGIKVGIGPGSICTTRIIAGIGVPQLSAIIEVAKVAQKQNIPVIADGGIKYSGDVVKALAGGASCVMAGSLLAGTNESPGELIYSEGKTYKYYRGMGSIAAMKKGGKERYAQNEVEDQKLVPEGIEGKILLKGPVETELFQLCGGIKSALGYNGVTTINALQKSAKFIQITPAGLKESHPHDVHVVNQAPNYRD